MCPIMHLSVYTIRVAPKVNGQKDISITLFLLFILAVVLMVVLLRQFVGLERLTSFKVPKFLVIGHRGNGMNMLQSSDLRMKAVKENTVLSFNTAGNYPVDFIEFDVQVYILIFPLAFVSFFFVIVFRWCFV